jgi:hypothetical protein
MFGIYSTGMYFIVWTATSVQGIVREADRLSTSEIATIGTEEDEDERFNKRCFEMASDVRSEHFSKLKSISRFALKIAHSEIICLRRGLCACSVFAVQVTGGLQPTF